MSSVFRRIVVCVCVFLPALWAWLAAPSYTENGRESWKMPGPLGSAVLNQAGTSYASLQECFANPSLLAETFLQYGRKAPTSPSATIEQEIRYMHGLYAMDSIRHALLQESRQAVRQNDLFTATLATVGAFKNACMKAIWIAMRGPAEFAVHGLLGLAFLALAMSLQLLIRRHAG